ncbi:MAG: hypothetical protein Kow00109_18350 [Acidobacteriota bacterium]
MRRRKDLVVGWSWVLVVAGLASCGGGAGPADPGEPVAPVEVTMELESGTFRCLVDPGSPAGELFLRLCRDGAWEETTIHRVAPGYLVQGGDPNTRNGDPADDGLGGLLAEAAPPAAAGGDAAAEGGVFLVVDPETGRWSSQFFVLLAAEPPPGDAYRRAGKLTAGRDFLERISEEIGEEYPELGGYFPRKPLRILRCCAGPCPDSSREPGAKEPGKPGAEGVPPETQ